jgi:hypothetical protein
MTALKLLSRLGLLLVCAVFQRSVQAFPPDPKVYADQNLFLLLGLPEAPTTPEVIEMRLRQLHDVWGDGLHSLAINPVWKPGYDKVAEAAKLLQDMHFQNAYLSERKKILKAKDLLGSKIAPTSKTFVNQFLSQMRYAETLQEHFQEADVGLERALAFVTILEDIRRQYLAEISKFVPVYNPDAADLQRSPRLVELDSAHGDLVTKPIEKILNQVFHATYFLETDTPENISKKLLTFREILKRVKALQEMGLPAQRMQIFANQRQFLRYFLNFIQYNGRVIFGNSIDFYRWDLLLDVLDLLDSEIPGVKVPLAQMFLELIPNLPSFLQGFPTTGTNSLQKLAPFMRSKNLRKAYLSALLARNEHPFFVEDYLMELDSEKPSETPRILAELDEKYPGEFREGPNPARPTRDQFLEIKKLFNIPETPDQVLDKEIENYANKISLNPKQRETLLALLQNSNLVSDSCFRRLQSALKTQ